MSKFKTWEEFEKDLKITPEQEEEIRIEMKIMQACIEAREKEKMTQAEISRKSGLTQSVVARVESGIKKSLKQKVMK